jgi:O-antigen/teichoic acid export membrane protein
MQSAGKTIARNSVASIIASFALKGLSFVYAIVVVRQLGDSLYGQYMTAVAFVGILSIFGDLGMATYGMREIAKDRGSVNTLFGNMVIIRSILSVLLIVLSVGLAMLLGYDQQLIGWIALTAAGVVLYAFQGPISVVIHGFERSDYIARLTVINQVVVIVTGGLFLQLGLGVTGVILATYCGVIVHAVLGWRKMRELTTPKFQYDLSAWPALLKASIPFGVISFASILSFKVDTVLLSFWRPAEEVGWYNVAYNLILALLVFSASFNSVLVPTISRWHAADPASVRRFYSLAVRGLWIFSLPITIGGGLLAEPLIVTIYGSEFATAAPAFQVLIWVLPAITLTSLCGSISTVLHRERRTARIVSTNAGFNIAMNLWAVPTYGLFGAAVVTVATEVLGLIQYAFLLRDTLSLREMAFLALRPLVASLVMGLAIALTPQLGLLVAIVLGAGVYALALLLVGGVRLAEVRRITSLGTNALMARRRLAQSTSAK